MDPLESALEENLLIQQAINSILQISLEPLSLEEQLHRVLDLIIKLPWLALEAKGCIFLVEDGPRTLVMTAQIGMPAGARAACARVPFGTCLCGQAIARKALVFASRVDERHSTRYEGIQPHGHYCVPIAYDERRLGLLSLYVREGHTPLPVEERFLRAVADILAGMIERRQAEGELRRQEHERHIAHRIQQGLLPKAMPRYDGFSIGGKSWPAHQVGGDCFDFIRLFRADQGCLGVVVADASGHGIGAALLMAETRAYLRALALTCGDAATLLALTNRRLASDLVTDHFVTLFLLVLDPRARSVQHSSAGHCPGYVLDDQGSIKAVLASTGSPLGIDPANEFPAGPPVALEPGDLLFLYTDGIVEAASPKGELFGVERALGVVHAHRHETPDEILGVLFDAVSDFCAHSPHDDITAVIIKAEGAACQGGR
jgi:serine phosphatase RsbU (regulator of sigma subunit)/putative methionine-R-sulfoxide reductase with GAF domain